MIEWLKGQFKRGPRTAREPLDVDGRALLSSGQRYFVVDLRDLSRYRQGHIKGSHLIPYVELQKRLHELPAKEPILTVDASERRGRQAAKLLRSYGYRAVNLRGGIQGWPEKLVK
ncbi:MAG: rhodanese-like domain-containing protein [Firmicutes bacterium]|jgi:rhodanese-related sulfurtransferase|nr:rhodanese-like domain-containing protein [Bacillota bacterium]